MLRSLRLENIGPFQTFEANFTEGINVIVGPNGSGKTTILNSIFSCLAYHDRDQKRGDLLTVGATSGSICCRMVWDLTFDVIFTIKYKWSKYVYDYQIRCENGVLPKRELPKFYESFFGSETFCPVYIRQGNLLSLFDSFSGLEEGTLKRKARTVLLRLLGASHFDPFLSALFKEVRYDEVNVRRNEVIAKLDKFNREINTYNRELESFPLESLEAKKNQLEAKRDELLVLCKNYDRFTTLAENKQKLEAWKSRVQNLKDELQKVVKDLNHLEKEITSLLIEIRKVTGQNISSIESALSFLYDQIQKNQTLIGKKEEYSRLYESIRKLFLSRPCPVDRLLEETQNQLQYLKSKEFLRFRLISSGICPVCHATYDPSRLDHSFEECSSQTIAELEEEIQNLLADKQERYEIAKKIAALISRTRQLKTEIEQLTKGLFPLEFASSLCSRLEELKPNFLSLFARKKELEAEIENTENKIEVISSGLCELFDLNLIPDGSVKEQFQQVKTELDEIRKAIQNFHVLKVRYEDQREAAQELEETLRSLNKEASVEENYLRFVQTLEQEIDNYCTEFFVERLLRSINSVLNEGNIPFRLEFTDEGLRARFSNGRLIPVSLFSYGQRVLVSLLFYLFFYLPLSSKKTILLLDEPIAHLDADTVTFLEKVFNELPRFVGGTMPQVILTTNQEGIYGNGRIDLFRIGA